MEGTTLKDLGIITGRSESMTPEYLRHVHLMAEEIKAGVDRLERRHMVSTRFDGGGTMHCECKACGIKFQVLS